LWFYDNYVIALAKKLKECGVFGVSSDEYLNYAIQNRNEWERKGKQCVAEFKAKCEREAQRKGLLGPASTKSIASMNEEKESESVAQSAVDGSYSSVVEAATLSIAQPIAFTAPPGRLGITIDTSKGCPVIFEVEAHSAIRKLVVPGDYIIEIDGVRVRDMSTAAISALVSAKQQQHRNFVIERPTQSV
jgi:C-terminal processing protease CtpA/Prc